MILSDISIKRPVFATIINLVLVVFGLFALPELAIDLMPNVDFPFVTVTVVYPGADPQTVEQKILDPLEQSVNGLSGLDQLIANAYPNVAQMVLRFKLEKNGDQAAQEVRDKIFAAVGNLPTEAQTPIIAKFDIGAQPIMNVAVNSKSLSFAALSDLVKNTVKPALERVPDVASVNPIGLREREIHIKLNRDQMEAYGLGPQDVVQGIGSQNIDLPAGSIKDASTSWNIRLKGRVTDASSVATLPLTTSSGQTLRVSDVAVVEDTIAEEETSAFTNTSPTVVLSVLKQSGSNTPGVAIAVRQKMAQLQKQLPKGTELTVVSDNSKYIVGAIDSVKLDLIIGAFLATMIVFLFLRDKWITMISAIALPTSVIATFAFLKYMNFTLNMLTTLGLSLAIGILIDDAIIVIENIYRHMQMGKSGMQAAKDATGEIGLAVFATTLAICAVFVPVAFMEGIIGRFFFQFGLTVTFAVLVSLFCAFTIAPMMASRFLTSTDHHQPQGTGLWGKYCEVSERFFVKIDNGYRRLLAWALHHRRTTLLVGVGIFISSIVMVAFVPVAFFPREDRAEIGVTYTLPEGTNIDGTKIKSLELIEALQKYPGVERVVATLGADSDQKTNKARFQVLLVDRERRRFSQDDLMKRMRSELAPLFGRDGAEFKVAEAGGMGGGKSEPIQFIFRSDNWDELVAFTEKVADFIRKNVPDTADATTSKPKPVDEYRVVIDKARATDLQVTAGQIGMALRTLFEGQKVGEIDVDGKSVDIRVRMADKDRRRATDLGGLTVRNRVGQLVQLSAVASITMGKAPSVIERLDGQRQITVLSNFSGKDLNKASNAIQKFVAANIPADITMRASGQTEMMSDSIRAMLKALAIAVLLVYMVLCAQYESYLAPLVIMAALPLSLSGAFGSLLITGQVMSVYTMIGIILLMGLVTKNGILLIDFTMQKMREGLTVNEALLEAGPIRLRPILMTTFAAGGGMVPVAIGHGLGGEGRSPMGVAVIGGLLVSTLLTRVVVPCLFSIVEQFRSRRRVPLRQRGLGLMQRFARRILPDLDA